MPLAEDYLHVYGVMPAAHADLLHPRAAGRLARRARASATWPRAFWRTSARTASRIRATCAPRWASASIRNGWGGNSAATTRMLEALQYRGKLRVARREAGIRLYALAAARSRPRAAGARARPTSWRCCCGSTHRCPEGACASSREWSAAVRRRDVAAKALARMLRRTPRFAASRRRRRRSSCLRTKRCDAGSRGPRARCWRRSIRSCGTGAASSASGAGTTGFEAYTPPAKRRFGYYALPLLWRDDVIGWANAASVGGTLRVTTRASRRRDRAAPRSAARWKPRSRRSPRAVGAARFRDRHEHEHERPVLFLIPHADLGLDLARDHLSAGQSSPRRCRCAIASRSPRWRSRVVRGDRPFAALFGAQSRVARRPGRADDGVQLHLDLLTPSSTSRRASSPCCSRRSCS